MKPNVTAAGFDSVSFVASLPRKPGVYRMLSAEGEVLYVGKARHLRDRVASYFLPSNVQPKVQVLIAQVANIEVTVAPSETEALILEYNLIKEHKPRYNVLMRDDKSFPYIQLATDHDYPRLNYYRGPRDRPGRYFGPFPNAYGVREALHHVQKVFRIRNCRDSYFSNRSRPCLQHQIGRCSAPCVGLITREAYAEDLQAAVRVLEGRDLEVMEAIAARMDKASATLEFEAAARLRDQLAALKTVQAQQIVAAAADRDADIFALVGGAADRTIAMMRVRGGRSLGTTSYHLGATAADDSAALASFLMQFYGAQPAPPEVMVNLPLEDVEALGEALSLLASRSVSVRMPQRGITVRWLALVIENAEQARRMRERQASDNSEQRAAFAVLLGLERDLQRFECFDISHTSGEGTVASCVVFDANGPLKKDYRRFNVTGVAAGDDYAALEQALRRRYTRIAAGEMPKPDVLLIDGGEGQRARVESVLQELGCSDVTLAAVSKGADRRPGQERLHLAGRAPIALADSAALRLIQRLRDEAHRFAITGHRRKRARRFNESILEAVPGLGPAKRRELLKHFGGLQGVLRAGVADFSAVPGIGSTLAQAIYDQMHPGE
jgi:excinuclease ABC subunit C